MLRECATYVNSEILQTFKLAQVYLQFGVNLQAFGFGILEEGPELLQSIKLAWRHETSDQSVPVDRGTETENSASTTATVMFMGLLTSLVIFNGLLLEVLEDVGPKLLLQTVAVVPEQAF